jgi:hypothetical protein
VSPQAKNCVILSERSQSRDLHDSPTPKCDVALTASRIDAEGAENAEREMTSNASNPRSQPVQVYSRGSAFPQPYSMILRPLMV